MTLASTLTYNVTVGESLYYNSQSSLGNIFNSVKVVDKISDRSSENKHVITIEFDNEPELNIGAFSFMPITVKISLLTRILDNDDQVVWEKIINAESTKQEMGDTEMFRKLSGMAATEAIWTALEQLNEDLLAEKNEIFK